MRLHRALPLLAALALCACSQDGAASPADLNVNSTLHIRSVRRLCP